MQADKADQRLKRLSKRLNLTDDQKEKLRPILQDEEKQMKAIDDDTSLTQQQKHRKTRDARMASRTQMENILTDEQKQKLGPAGQHGGGQHHGRHNRTTTAAPNSATTSPDQTSPQ
jgi:Spy/CpxP family protein refolding chaperone